MEPAAIFLAWRQLAEADPAILAGLSGKFSFQVDNEAWHVLAGPPCVVGKGAIPGGDACALRLSAQTFGRMVAGDLNPQQAFLEGTLQIAGNAKSALRASLVIDRLQGQVSGS